MIEIFIFFYMQSAIQLSLSNNLDLQAARIEVELAKNGVKIANRLQNPDFNIFYNYGRAGKSEPQQIGCLLYTSPSPRD